MSQIGESANGERVPWLSEAWYDDDGVFTYGGYFYICTCDDDDDDDSSRGRGDDGLVGALIGGALACWLAERWS